jgi:tRNA1Val (adenine37-N6)-methyltransferase
MPITSVSTSRCYIWASVKKVRDFAFKQFRVFQQKSTHKVGTDGVLLGAWVRMNNAEKILDIGTGSGVIALMLAQRAPNAAVDAVEIQEDDAMQADLNFQSSQWHDRLKIHHVAFQEYVSESKYDLIVSNPPYFVNSTLPPTSQRSIVRHSQMLTSEVLIHGVERLLLPGGIFGIILPVVEGRNFIKVANEKGLYLQRTCEFRSRPNKPEERLLMEFGFNETAVASEQIILYRDDTGEEWSEAYKALTRDFYLKI